MKFEGGAHLEVDEADDREDVLDRSPGKVRTHLGDDRFRSASSPHWLSPDPPVEYFTNDLRAVSGHEVRKHGPLGMSTS